MLVRAKEVGRYKGEEQVLTDAGLHACEHTCHGRGLTCPKFWAAPMPTLVIPHIAVPAAVSALRFSALPAEPMKGVASAWRERS